jgi:hypothetical protein
MMEGETHIGFYVLIKAFSLLWVDKFCEKFHDFSIGNAPSYRPAGRDFVSSRVPEFFLNIQPASYII